MILSRHNTSQNIVWSNLAYLARDCQQDTAEGKNGPPWLKWHHRAWHERDRSHANANSEFASTLRNSNTIHALLPYMTWLLRGWAYMLRNWNHRGWIVSCRHHMEKKGKTQHQNSFGHLVHIIFFAGSISCYNCLSLWPFGPAIQSWTYCCVLFLFKGHDRS